MPKLSKPKTSKTIPVILMAVGVVLIVSAGIFILDSLTSAEPEGLGKWVFDVLTLALGAGASIKGWMDLGNKQSSKNNNKRTQEVIDSPGSEQIMKGKGGIQKQKSVRSERSKQKME